MIDHRDEGHEAPNDEAPAGGTAQGFREVAQAVSHQSIAEVEKADKSFAMLRATMAVHGYLLHILSDGARGAAYLVQRWGMHKELEDLDAVAAFARKVGAA